MRPRAGAVGDIDRVGQALERYRFAQKLLRIAGHRRRKLRGHDELALAQPVLQRAGEGGATRTLFVHCGLGSGRLPRKRLYALPRYINSAVNVALESPLESPPSWT